MSPQGSLSLGEIPGKGNAEGNVTQASGSDELTPVETTEPVKATPLMPTPKISKMGYNPANFAYWIGNGPWVAGYSVYYAISFYDATTGSESARSDWWGTQDGPQEAVWRFGPYPDPGGSYRASDNTTHLAKVRGATEKDDEVKSRITAPPSIRMTSFEE